MAIVTDAQRASINPVMREWVAAKDKENATVSKADPAVAASYQAAANQFKANNWGPNQTANGMTGDQNLAAVIKQPGNTVANNPTPYIQGVLTRAAADDQRASQPAVVQPETKVLDTNSGGGNNGGGNNGGGNSGVRASSNGTADLINQQYDQNYQSQLQKLREARQIQQQGLNMQETGVNQNALQNLNNNDAMANTQLKKLQEVMANNGVRGGDSITATIGNQTAQQQGANQINQDKMNQLTDIQQKRSLIDNNASANDFSLMQQLQAARSGQLIDNNNTQDQRALQLAMLMGKTADGQQTLGGQQQALAAQGQGFNQNLQTNQFGLQKDNQTFTQGLQRDQFGLQKDNQTFNQGQQGFQNRLNFGQATGTFGDGQKTTQQQQIDMQKDPNSIDNQLKSAQAEYYKDHGQYYSSGGGKGGGGQPKPNPNSYTGTVYDELAKLDPADHQAYLEANSADIVRNIGQKAYDELKKSITADQNGQDKVVTAGEKAKQATKDKAIASAQRDPDWKYATATERAALIKQYEGYHQ